MTMSIRPDLSPAIVSRSSCGVTEAAELGDVEGELRHPLAEAVEMLLGEDRRRDEDGDLMAVIDRFESRPHGDFRLAEADVAAEQPVHRPRAVHVPL